MRAETDLPPRAPNRMQDHCTVSQAAVNCSLAPEQTRPNKQGKKVVLRQLEISSANLERILGISEETR
jgi:hypothetical protein